MTEPDTGAVHEAAWRSTLVVLTGREDRFDLAATAGWLAVCGENISQIARQMQRSRDWVRTHIATLKATLYAGIDTRTLEDYLR